MYSHVHAVPRTSTAHRLNAGRSGDTSLAAPQPLDREILFRLAGPVVGAVFATVLVQAAHGGALDPASVFVAALLAAVTVAAVAFAPWPRWPPLVKILPPLAFVAIALLLHGVANDDPGHDLLVLLPVVWSGLYGTRREVLVVVAAVAAETFAVEGLADWPMGIERSLFVVASAALLGLAVQQALAQARVQTSALRAQARLDHLTATGNRLAWDETVRRALPAAARRGEAVSVVVLDLDHFKEFNDRSGHQSGDHLLQGAARAWTEQLRRSDLLARLGGDEFAVLLDGCGAEPAVAVARRLCRSVPPEITCSAGVACWDGGESPDRLLARADEAMYRAKAAGRDRVERARSGC